ncbi:unnamed protein product [Vitrella brassicaformis CCMP3155]|uniref:Uncharacterized protein n=2 Tax=Vitrella brassicaformis TaxID=1169539 RepID=A0A0G4F8B7_VITBC|nr:unnamed protein product [Vitrella brassicaformis CCMP3155]|eukprot:CEM08953.1 unnamed protein product [Vitrella brassicaformis CCMP3155]
MESAGWGREKPWRRRIWLFFVFKCLSWCPSFTFLLRSHSTARPRPRRFSATHAIDTNAQDQLAPPAVASTSHSSVADEHLTFLRDVAAVPEATLPSKELPHFISLLQRRGYEVVSPSPSRGNFHPFFIPLARNTSADESNPSSYLGLLKWPSAPEDMPLPVVRPGPSGVSLVSFDIRSLMKRFAVEEDLRGDETAGETVQLVNSLLNEGEGYELGDVHRLGLGLPRYLALKRVGRFPDVYEALVDLHLAKGDTYSAMVASEKYYKEVKGWGRPLAYHADLMATHRGNTEVARDAAKVALKLPIWTTAADDAELRRTVDLAADRSYDEYRDSFLRRSRDPRTEEIQRGRKLKYVVALERAAWLMDAMMFGLKSKTGGEGPVYVPWSAIKQQLADLYTEGGAPEMARFVLT